MTWGATAKRLALAMLVVMAFTLLQKLSGWDTDLFAGWFAAVVFYRAWELDRLA